MQNKIWIYYEDKEAVTPLTLPPFISLFLSLSSVSFSSFFPFFIYLYSNVLGVKCHRSEGAGWLVGCCSFVSFRGVKKNENKYKKNVLKYQAEVLGALREETRRSEGASGHFQMLFFITPPGAQGRPRDAMMGMTNMLVTMSFTNPPPFFCSAIDPCWSQTPLTGTSQKYKEIFQWNQEVLHRLLSCVFSILL